MMERSTEAECPGCWVIDYAETAVKSIYKDTFQKTACYEDKVSGDKGSVTCRNTTLHEAARQWSSYMRHSSWLTNAYLSPDGAFWQGLYFACLATLEWRIGFL